MVEKLPFCPVETTLSLIGDKWKVIIIRDLMDGTKRFGELKKTVGKVSQKVLTSNLRDMEGMGLVYRKVYAEVPPRVEYTLTDTGYSLKPILDAMMDWGIDYKKKNSCYLNSEILGENSDIAHIQNRMVVIEDLSSAINLANTVKHETDLDKIIVYRSNFKEDIFLSSPKELQDILEKFQDYNLKVAVIGDFEDLKSKAFVNFIDECNNGSDFFFVSTIEDAILKLS